MKKFPQSGFSLIEVMIAVLILSTGLLALAALQGSLTKASADAKVRSQVAALLQARMDQLRTTGYASATNAVTDSCATNVGATDGSDWVPQSFCTRTGLGALSASQSVATYTSAVGAASFGIGAPANPDDPQFKRVTIDAIWTDSEGASNRRLALSSDISELGLKDSLVTPPENTSLSGQRPIVHTSSPATAGVIPIAIGGNDATAATNPRPEIIGQKNNQSAVGTTFNVLTYTNETGGVQIQKRIENTLIQCSCQYGAAGSNFSNLPEISRAAQWPAIWNGDTYEVYTPASATAAPGQTYLSAPTSDVTQSPLCTECCRDHHDTSATGVVKFDPERVPYIDTANASKNDTGIEKYSRSGGVLTKVPNTNNSTYIDSCRVIRVDGFWRVAADTYARQVGLLATETDVNDSSRLAATGVPNATATSAYQQFVKDYLAEYIGTSAPVIPAVTRADILFADPGRGLNDPPSITINRPTPQDERYLHARGLYVDHLEQKALDKLTYVIGNCTTTPKVECVLPYLPFNTVNVTELGFWKPTVAGVQNNSILSVTTGSTLIYDPLQPTRGRTNALSAAANGDTADATTSITSSNAGLAISITGVDPLDNVDKMDSQAFVVSAPLTPGTGDPFNVTISGLPQVSDTNSSNDPAVAWVISTASGNCVATVTKTSAGPNPYVCNSTQTLGVAGSVLFSNYFREYTVSESRTASCTDGGTAYSVTDTVPVPTFENYEINSATILGVSGSIGAPLPNDAKKTESTSVSFALIPANSTVLVGFRLQGTLKATIASCTTNGGHNQINNIVWTKSWEAP